MQEPLPGMSGAALEAVIVGALYALVWFGIGVAVGFWLA